MMQLNPEGFCFKYSHSRSMRKGIMYTVRACMQHANIM